MIYLDYNATTPIAPEVAAGIQPYLHNDFGNPSCDYSLGQRAKAALEQARGQVAELLGCQPEEIVFVSGASEANNWVLKGVAHYHRRRGKHFITTVIEHPAVITTPSIPVGGRLGRDLCPGGRPGAGGPG